MQQPEWPIKVLHTIENRHILTTSPAFQRQTSSGHITLQQLPTNVTLTNHAAISTFFAKPWLWNTLSPYKHLLVFQTDSILCANPPRTVDEFLEYDFIGAPIDPAYGNGNERRPFPPQPGEDAPSSSTATTSPVTQTTTPSSKISCSSASWEKPTAGFKGRTRNIIEHHGNGERKYRIFAL
ncbi:MAG: hypothetical protein Q9186_001664 [Xanthomendoza sp. 1 TL-2023]